MRLKHRFSALFILAAGLGLSAQAPAAHAQSAGEHDGEARCLILGPLAVSSYLSFLEKVGSGERNTSAVRARDAVAVTQLHNDLGCDGDKLNAALECVSAELVGGRTQESITDLAQSCMEQAGMPTR